MELEIGHVATLQYAVLAAELRTMNLKTLKAAEPSVGDSPDWAVVRLASLKNYFKKRPWLNVLVKKLPTVEEPRLVGGQYMWKLWEAIDELARQQDWPIGS